MLQNWTLDSFTDMEWLAHGLIEVLGAYYCNVLDSTFFELKQETWNIFNIPIPPGSIQIGACVY